MLTNNSGQACFVCEKETTHGDLRHGDGSPSCPRCPNIKTKSLSGQDLLKHIGAHILCDEALKGAKSPCGFCLNTGTLCEIYLVVRSDAPTSINMAKSRCQNLRRIKLKLAENFTTTQPCTNHPLICSLCSKDSPAVWKYNLKDHIVERHPFANPDLYEPIWRISSDERTLMRGVYLAHTRMRPSTKSKDPTLAVSDMHSSRLALRYVIFFG